MPEECLQVGREYFARAPGSDIWVSFYDLPDSTRDRLWKKHSSRLALPAGLSYQDELFADDAAEMVEFRAERCVSE